MKNLILVFILLSISINSFSQKSSLAIGANFNADYVDQKSGKLTYPSFEINYERALGKKFSFELGYNYAKRNYKINNYAGSHSTILNIDHNFILGTRYYIKSNKEGFFFQFDIPVTYTIEKDYFDSQKTYEHGWWSVNSFIGIGIKYPINKNIGLEMNLGFSPPINFIEYNYGTAGYFKSGLKIYFNMGSKR